MGTIYVKTIEPSIVKNNKVVEIHEVNRILDNNENSGTSK